MEPPRDHTPPETAGRSPGSAAGNGHEPDSAAVPPIDAVKQAAARFGELKEYASYFIGAKVDGIKLTLRNILLYAVLGIVGGIAALGLLITAAVFLLSGLAGAIGELFPEPSEWWAGRLIVGAVVLGGALGGVFFLMKSLTGASRTRTIEKYEARKREERNLYGHDVQERAREQVERQHAN